MADKEEAELLDIWQKRKAYEAAMEEYTQRCKDVPVLELKKIAGSWVVMVLAILTTITAAMSAIALITSIKGGWFFILIAVVKLLLNVLVCVGFWQSYSMGKSKGTIVNFKGPKMLTGMLKFYKVMTYFIMSLLLILAIVILILVARPAQNSGASSSDVMQMALTVPAIVLLVSVIVVFAVLIIYYSTITGFAYKFIDGLKEKRVTITKSTGAVVFFFIIGIGSLISTILYIISVSMINGFIGQLQNQISFLKFFGMLFGNGLTINVADTITQIVGSLTYIFAGILAIKFGGVDQKMDIARKAIEKPEKPEIDMPESLKNKLI